MTLPTVCIVAAGTATRMGEMGKTINKSLLPITGKATLSHAIDQFPAGSHFVIAVGYLGQQVRDYVALMHPDLNVTFCDVDNYEGPGSGPLYSLSCCRAHLDKPFFFMPGDGLYQVDWEAWLGDNRCGVAEVSEEETADYCNFVVDERSRITEVINKQTVPGGAWAFTGLMHIHDHQAFWECPESAQAEDEGEISAKLKRLARTHGVSILHKKWRDLGTLDRYKAVLSETENYDFSKTAEFLYSAYGHVVKFFADPKVSARRVEKAAVRPDAFPAIEGLCNSFYSYGFVEGQTLYQTLTPALFRRLLTWLEAEIWPVPPAAGGIDIAPACRTFYEDKTRQRLGAYAKKYPDQPVLTRVNGQPVRPLAELIKAVDWASLCKGVPAFIHGDLQFDNILWDGKRFTLLDWRHEFAGLVAVGDLYYDLGKLLGGIILNYDYVKLGLLTYQCEGTEAEVDFAQRFRADEYVAVLEEYVTSRGLDFARVKLLTALIYLNMSPLHHPPFDTALLALGTRFLDEALGG